MHLRQRVDLRYTRLSGGLRLVEFAELDEGAIFDGSLPEERYCIYYRVDSTESHSNCLSSIIDYSGARLNPDVLRHLEWFECK